MCSHAQSTVGTSEAEIERVRVLLPLPLEAIYDYAVPGGMALEPGELVEVPLGNRLLIGVVWDDAEDAGEHVPTSRLKPVHARLPAAPLPQALRRLIEWVARYTLAPIGNVLRMAIPVSAALRPERPQRALRRASALPEALRETPTRNRVLAVAADGLARTASDLAREAGVGASVVKGLADAGALEWVELPVHLALAAPDPEQEGYALGPVQQVAADQLRGRIGQGFTATLLDGVTGSGKTEVYFEAVAEALRAGQQVLVLQPEIALSSQWLARFEARFGTRPAEWHSELTPAQRRLTWRAVADGSARVVVGARSALFLPFTELGLIVVDEEHDPAYKQEEGVIYQARDMAVLRASLEHIPIVLASATPSLESVMNVKVGKYEAVHLPLRHGSAELPKVGTVDLRRDAPPRLPNGARGWLSQTLRDRVQATLEAGEQALLFLNRRGYAPLTLCRACGHRLQCPNCTTWLVEHRLTGRLQCHHCGHASRLPSHCPACEAEDSLAACGPGVERLDEEVALLFPEARRLLLSSDVLTGPAATDEVMRRIREREVDLVVGTQIVAKGHHFPWLTLVGVVDADLGLAGGDLRAGERSFQLLHQVSGRAGRAERPGQVLLQTYEPEHPVIHALVAGDRDAFLEREAAARRQGSLPPFTRLAALILSAPDPNIVDTAASTLARSAPRAEGLQVLGPAPAPLAVLRGRHRRRFLIKARRDLPLQTLLKEWVGPVPLRGGLRIQVDIDPYSFL
ncbi:primosomal protein N' [Aquibaculum sediminis]|uniref:primosomal protein N' n=1 Tax=Aquibaculum sediminis TaxID=3231907 RepID=UPI003F6050A5